VEITAASRTGVNLLLNKMMIQANEFRWNTASAPIGKGQFAKVFKGYDIKAERHIAVKHISISKLLSKYNPSQIRSNSTREIET
jgi:hypothetical protein